MESNLAGVTAHLHSRYNPHAEAERYIEALDIGNTIECFILIEPGLGYMIPILRRKYPCGKIIALHAGVGFPEFEDADVSTWRPGGDLTVEEFLEREVPDTDTDKLRIIEWRPGLQVFGEAYVRLLSGAVEFVKRADAGRRTVSFFGRRWVKNFFRNLVFIRKAMLYRAIDIPVIVTGAGPGLETALPKIRRMREGAFILAASSSVLALYHGGVVPDMVIGTDGGGWALNHFYHFFRAEAGQRGTVALAATLSAALPSQSAALPLLILNDGSLWQSVVLEELGLPSVIIPQRGTVTASALELAMVLSTGSIYVAGMDLGVRDIITHARPYGFDYLFYGAASRFMPVYSQNFFRCSGIRQGGSHDIYAAWFKNQLAHWPKRVFSLGGSHAVFGNESSLPRQFPRRKSNDDHFKALPVGVESGGDGMRRRLCEKGAASLIRALGDASFAGSLNAELAPLLFPGEAEITNERLIMAIADIAGRYGKAPHG